MWPSGAITGRGLVDEVEVLVRGAGMLVLLDNSCGNVLCTGLDGGWFGGLGLDSWVDFAFARHVALVEGKLDVRFFFAALFPWGVLCGFWINS